MAFGGMRTSGPSCCCCMDLYTLGRVNSTTVAVRLRKSGSAASIVNSASQSIGHLNMDFLNKKVYGNTYFRWDEDLSNGVQVVTPPTGTETQATSRSSGIWPHPGQEYLFYLNTADYPGIPPGGAILTHEVRRADYDGGNDTLLTSHDEQDQLGQLTQPVAVKDQDYLFYLRDPTSGDHEIRRIGFDGTGDTVVRTALSIPHLRVDNTNGKLMWCEVQAGSTTILRFFRSDFDGTNDEQYFSLASSATVAQVPFWSHKLQRIYYFQLTPAASRGLWSIDYNGGDLTLEIDDADWDNGGIPQNSNPVKPGCGFEFTGAEYQV